VTIPGVAIVADAAGVAVKAATPLTVASSALVGGGVASVRAILNVRVPKGFQCVDSAAALAAFAARHDVREPYVGLLTAARAEAEQAAAARGALRALAVVTVGLSNAVTAGVSPAAGAATPSTINTIVIVDGDAEPAALVNAVMTVTEVKTLALIEAGVKGANGHPATGTSTDAVAVAVTGHGPRARFGGPISDLGWVVGQAAGAALRRGIARWLAEHPA
jgi:adenosylcobinamide kinase/adenosylcobinamide-phosphate guanylyltransferase